MSSNDQDSGWSQLTRGAPLAVLVAAALYIIYMLLPVLELVAVAALIALLFRTALHWLRKFVRVQWAALVLLVGIVAGFVAFIGLVLLPNLFQESEILLQEMPKYLNSLKELSRQLHDRASFVPDFSQGVQQLKGILDQILRTFPLLIRSTFELSLESIATLILAIYMAIKPESLIGGLLRLAPRQQHARIRKLLASIKVRLQGWLFGTGLAIAIIGIGATVGLLILGIPLALSFGFLAGILEIIPYVGSIVGALLPALVALTISPVKALLVVVFFLILNQVDAHLIQPIVMGQRVHLSPVAVVLAFLILGKLLGLIGVLLAVPAAAVLVALVDELTPPPSPEEAPSQDS